MSKVLFSAIIALLVASPALADPTQFNVVFSGNQEVPSGAGDPDGFGSGAISFDPDPPGATVEDIYGIISWNITYGNIGTIIGFHIHEGPFGTETPGTIIVGLATTTSGGPGTLVHTYNFSNWNGEWNTLELNQILANPENYYLNIHTDQFPNGAIRAQIVPEPASLGALMAGGLALLLKHRRRRAA